LHGIEKVWFICDKCDQSFDACPDNVVNGKWCPFCCNKTEGLIKTWCGEVLGQRVLKTHASFAWCRSESTKRTYPFDFYIPDLSLIIELDGAHHFEQVRDWNTPQETRERDVYKMTQGFEQSISFLRLAQKQVWDKPIKWRVSIQKFLTSYQVCSEPTLFIFQEHVDFYDKHLASIQHHTSYSLKIVS
jgi:very-short-patch-repair endonuclease